jgi:hypothetical protein
MYFSYHVIPVPPWECTESPPAKGHHQMQSLSHGLPRVFFFLYKSLSLWYLVIAMENGLRQMKKIEK